MPGNWHSRNRPRRYGPRPRRDIWNYIHLLCGYFSAVSCTAADAGRRPASPGRLGAPEPDPPTARPDWQLHSTGGPGVFLGEAGGDLGTTIGLREDPAKEGGRAAWVSLPHGARARLTPIMRPPILLALNLTIPSRAQLARQCPTHSACPHSSLSRYPSSWQSQHSLSSPRHGVA